MERKQEAYSDPSPGVTGPDFRFMTFTNFT